MRKSLAAEKSGKAVQNDAGNIAAQLLVDDGLCDRLERRQSPGLKFEWPDGFDHLGQYPVLAKVFGCRGYIKHASRRGLGTADSFVRSGVLSHFSSMRRSKGISSRKSVGFTMKSSAPRFRARA